MRDIRTVVIYRLLLEYTEQLAREGRDETRPIVEQAIELLAMMANPEPALPPAVETFLRAL